MPIDISIAGERRRVWQRSGGFTIVETIVIVTVISILLTISIASYQGVLPRARDRERQHDTSIISRRLEFYYRMRAAEIGPSYPTADDIEQPSMKNYIDGSEVGKTSGVSRLVAAADNSDQSPTKDQYIYQPLGVAGQLCKTTADRPCVRFILYHRLEVSDEIIKTESIRQQ